jgi:single-stranded DNA-binding protein
MTFSTATIQGYVTFMKTSTTPNNRAVVNMLLSVPNKRQNGTTADTYKVSVWDSQALAAAQYISAERKQIITCSGTLRLDEYSVEQGKPMMRLDFASILDYGNSRMGEAQLSDKQKFVNMIDSVDDAKLKATSVKKKVAVKA